MPISKKGHKGFIKDHGHGTQKTKVYRAWRSMNNRCYNKNTNRYELYGGRGIVVCDRWRNSFKNFLEDMGEPPSDKHSLDRINTNGDYGPSNCKWSDIYEQANNKRRNVFIEVKGIKMTVSQADRFLGLPSNTVKSRLYQGWSIERATTTPLRKLINGKYVY